MKPASIRTEKLRISHTVDGTRMQHAAVLSVVDFIPEDSIDLGFVGWSVNTDVSVAADQPVCLRFVMQEVAAFAFQFRGIVSEVLMQSQTGTVLSTTERSQNRPAQAGNAVMSSLRRSRCEARSR